ncbi:MAG: hypothetical protein HUU35_06245 [Armatimonadetes bacterium]|nr:hypothetical protein [Armatimonadota bacterium]
MIPRCLRFLIALLAPSLPVAGAVRAETTEQGIVLENDQVRAVFSARANYTLTELRRLPNGPNVLAYCLLGYTVEGARYWFQDNKTDDFGLRPVATRVEEGLEAVTLTVTYPAAGEAKHFAVTKTHTLRAGSAVLESKYRLEAVREIALRGGLSLPLIRFGVGLSNVVVPQADGSLTLGEAGVVQRVAGAPRWVGALAPDSGEGVVRISSGRTVT